MHRWQNKVAVVTGASSGIGAAVAKSLVIGGMNVVGLARRSERIIEMRNSLSLTQKSRLHAIKCDVTSEKDVMNAFMNIENNFGGTDILVNNAGTATSKYNLVSQNNTSAMKLILDTNVMSVLYCTREAFRSMQTRNVDGHVVMMNSVLGHRIGNFLAKDNLPSSNMYSPSKYALCAMVETYRQEFAKSGTKIKVTSISPGLVETEMIPANVIQKNHPRLSPENIADAVLYVLSTPPHVQVHELTIKPIGEYIV